jgi:lysophospholipase L1-like esterase
MSFDALHVPLRARALAAFGLVALASACAVTPADQSASTEDNLDVGPVARGPFQQGLSIAQNTIWTVNRNGTQKYRVVAYGDSIFAGYQGAFTQVARRAAPYVAGEYLAQAWGANVEVVRRAESGGLASEVYTRIVNDKSYMEDPSTRAVYFEMCGNDYLQVRRAWANVSGNCDASKFQVALDTCVANTQKAMDQINTSATTARVKVVMNLYYPGFNADNVATTCHDPATGQPANVQKALLTMIAHSNWKTCDLARRNGFACADAFAQFMGADYDSNGDGKIDSDALRFDPAETEADYVARISETLRDTVHDSNTHGLTDGGQTADYLYTDDTHPTIYLGMINTNSNGTSPPDFTDDQVVGGKNPKWNMVGHERIGWTLSTFGPATP